MNTLHMIQIAPVVAHIYGWGDTMRQEVSEVKSRCNLVTAFTLGEMTVRRIEGTGADYAADSWVVDTGLSLKMVNMSWAGNAMEFKQGMF